MGVEKRAPTPEEIAAIPPTLTTLPPQAGSPFIPKPVEKIEKPFQSASYDISKASMDLQKQADVISGAMMTDRAMHGHAARQQLERVVEDEDDRRQMREQMEDIEEEAAHAEAQREEGDDDALATTADDVRTGVADLGDVAGAAEALRAAGVDPTVVRAVQQAARDMRAGERGEERDAFRERGQLIVEMARFYADHLPALRQEGMEQALQGLERALTALCRQAEQGTTSEAARDSAQQGRGIFDRIRAAVTDREGLERGAATARLQNQADQCAQFRPLVADEGLRRELDSLRRDLDEARQRMGRGERVTDEEMRSLQGRMELLSNARDSLLAGREGREAQTLQGMVGRALSALRGGNPEQSAAQMFIAGQFAQAGREFREELARHSEALASGAEQIGATLSFLSNHFASALERFTTGRGAVQDERSRGFLDNIISALRGGEPGMEGLRRASLALESAERLSGAERRIAEMPQARRSAASRVIGIFQRCLQTLSNQGPVEDAAFQLELADRYATAPRETREPMERMSARMMRGSNVRAMDRVLSGRELPADPTERRRALMAAAREVLGSEASEAELEELVQSFEQAGADSEAREQTGQALSQQAGGFLMLLERRAGVARMQRRAAAGSSERGLYDRMVSGIDSLLGDMGQGNEISEDRLRTADLQSVLLAGNEEQIGAAFAASEDQDERRAQLEAVRGLNNMRSVLSSLRGQARERAAQIYSRAMDALSEGRIDDAIAYCSFAQAYAQGNAQERTRILAYVERFEAGLGAEGAREHPPEGGALSPQAARQIARLFLDRTMACAGIEDARLLASYRRYSDITLQAAESGDLNGAQMLRNIAEMYARAAALGSEGPEAQAVLGLSGGNEGLGIPSLEALESALSGEPPRTVAQALFPDADEAEASSRVQVLGLQLADLELGLGVAEFNSRSADPSARTSAARYSAERTRLESLRDRAEDPAERERLEREIAIVDSSEVAGSFRQAEQDYAQGTDLLRQASRLRIQALRTEDAAERERLNGEADALSTRGVLLMEAAEGSQSALLTLHRSVVRIRTRHREDGRSDLASASEGFESAAERIRTEPEGELTETAAAEIIQGIEGASSDLQSGALHVAMQWGIQQQAAAILRSCDELEERNDGNFHEVGRGASALHVHEGEEQPPETVEAGAGEGEEGAAGAEESAAELEARTEVEGAGTVYLPSRPGEEGGAREIAYRHHLVQARIEAARHSARAERFASARRYVDAASEQMDIEMGRVEAVLSFDSHLHGDPSLGIMPASAEEQSLGRLNYIDLDAQLSRLETATTLVSRGRIRESAEVRGDVHESVLVSGERQRRGNMLSIVGGQIEALEAQGRASETFGELPGSASASMDPDSRAAHDRAARAIRESGALDGVDESRAETLDELRATRAELESSIEAVHTIDDIADAQTRDLVARAAAELASETPISGEYAAAALRREGGLLQSDRDAAAYLGTVLDDPQAVARVLSEHPALLRTAVRVLEGEGNLTAGEVTGVLADASFRQSEEHYQDRAVGWNLSLRSASEGLDILDRADQLLRASRGSRQERTSLRGHAAVLIQLAHYAGDHADTIADEIESGAYIHLEGIDLEIPGAGAYEDVDIHHDALAGDTVLNIYRNAIGAEFQILQDIGQDFFNIGPEGAEANDEQSRAFRAQVGEHNWRLMTGHYQEALALSDMDVRLTFAGLGFDADLETGRARRAELTAEEQDVLQEAMASVSVASSQFLGIVTSLRSWVSLDSSGGAFSALYTHAQAAGQVADSILRRGEGEAPPDLDALRGMLRTSEHRTFGRPGTSDTGIVGAYLEQGRDTEWYANTARTILMVPLSAALMSTGFGIPMAAYFLMESIESFEEMYRAAGSWDSMRTEQRILGIGGIALAGVGLATAGATSYLSELGAASALAELPAAQLSRGARILQTATAGMGYSMMVGGLGMGALQMYDMYEHGGSEVRILDYVLAGFQAAQPFLQMGGHAAAARWAPNLMVGTGIGARMYQLGMFGLFGVTRAQSIEQFHFQQREAFTRRLNSFPEGMRSESRASYIEANRSALASIEATLGRPLAPGEGLAILDYYGGRGRDGRPLTARTVDPAEGAELLRRFETYAQEESARLGANFEDAITRIESDSGRMLSADEMLTLGRHYPEGIPETGEALAFLDRARADGSIYSLAAFAHDHPSGAEAPAPQPRPETLAGRMRERRERATFAQELVAGNLVGRQGSDEVAFVRGDDALVYSREDATDAGNAVYYAERLLAAGEAELAPALARVPADVRGTVERLIGNSDFIEAVRGSDRRRQMEIGLAESGAEGRAERIGDRVESLIQQASELHAAGRHDEARAVEAEYTSLDRSPFRARPSPEEPRPSGPGPRGTTREAGEELAPSGEEHAAPETPAPPQAPPQEAPAQPRLELAAPSMEEQVLRTRAEEAEASLAGREGLAEFALRLFREGDNPDGDAHMLMRRMSPEAQAGLERLVESEAFARFAPTVPEGESPERISARLRLNPALSQELEAHARRLSEGQGIPQEEEARAVVNYEGPEADVRGGLIEGGLPRPEEVVAMAGGGFSPTRIFTLRDAAIQGPAPDLPGHVAREVDIAQRYARAGYSPDEASLAALSYTSYELARSLSDFTEAWCSGDPVRQDAAYRNVLDQYADSPETVRMIIDTLTYLDAIHAGGMDPRMRDPMLQDAARSIVQSWGGHPEPVGLDVLESLVDAAHNAVYGDGRITPPRDPAHARALGRLIAGMRQDHARMLAGEGPLFQAEDYRGVLQNYFPEFGLEASGPAAESRAVPPVSPVAGMEESIQAAVLRNIERNLEDNVDARRALEAAGLHWDVAVRPLDDGQTIIRVEIQDSTGRIVDDDGYNSRRIFPPSEPGGEPVVYLDWVGVPESLRRYGISDVINSAVDSALSEHGIRSVYLQAAIDGQAVWPRRGYIWLRDGAELESVGDNQSDFVVRTWEGETPVRERFRAWADEHPEWSPPGGRALDEYLEAAGDNLGRYPAGYIESVLAQPEPQNIQERFIRWFVEGNHGSMGEAQEFLERYGNRPRFYPEEFLTSIGGLVPYIRPASLADLPAGLLGMPAELGGLRIDPVHGRQGIEILRPLDDVHGSGGALYLARMDVDGKPREVAVKILRSPREPMPETRDRMARDFHDLYSRYQEAHEENPANWARVGGFSEDEVASLQRLNHLMDSGMTFEQAMDDQALFQSWDELAGYYLREVEQGQVLADLDVGPRVYGRVDAGEGNMAYAMDVVTGVDSQDVSAAELASMARRNGISVEEQVERILGQVDESYSRLLENNWESSGDFQFALLTRPQRINGRQRQAGEVVFWDPGAFQRVAVSEEPDSPLAPRMAPGQPEVPVLSEGQMEARARVQVEEARSQLEGALAEHYYEQFSDTADSPLMRQEFRRFMLEVSGVESPGLERTLGFDCLDFNSFIRTGGTREERTEAILARLHELGERDPAAARRVFDNIRSLETNSHIRLLPEGPFDDVVPRGGGGPAPPVAPVAPEPHEAPEGETTAPALQPEARPEAPPAAPEVVAPAEARPRAREEAPLGHSERAQDMVSLVEGTLEREPSPAERIISDYLASVPEFLEARASGDRDRMLSIAEQHARFVEGADHVVLRQDAVDAAFEDVVARYQEPGAFHDYVNSVAAREEMTPEDILSRMALANVRCESLRATEIAGQLNSVVAHRQSVRFVDGERVREDSYTYGGEARGVPERTLTREEYEAAGRAIREAELSLVNGTDPATLGPEAQALLRNPEFVAETRQIMEGIAAGRPVDRFRQLGMALEPGSTEVRLDRPEGIQATLLSPDISPERYHEALDAFARLPAERQSEIIYNLRRQIINTEDARNEAFTAGREEETDALRSRLARERTAVRDMLLSSTMPDAMEQLASHLGIGESFALDDNISGMMVSGELLDRLVELHPDMDSIRIRRLGGMVGAYEFTIADADGLGHREYIKPVDMRPDEGGSLAYREGSIPAPRTIARDEDGAPLTYRTEDGAVHSFGISQDIRDFEGFLHLAGRDVEVRAVAAAGLNELGRPLNSELFDILMSNPRLFWEQMGFLLAAEYMLGSMDGHEGNCRAMLLEVRNPGDVTALRDAGYTIIPGEDGTSRIFMFGRIDTDDAGGLYMASGQQGAFDLTGQQMRMGGQHFLLRLFEHLAQQMNMRTLEEHPWTFDVPAGEVSALQSEGWAIRTEPDGRYTLSTTHGADIADLSSRGLTMTGNPADHFVTVLDLVQEAFGTGNSGPVFQGAERWWREVGSTQGFQDAIRDGFRGRAGDPVGVSWSYVAADPTLRGQLETEGVAPLAFPMNGEGTTPAFFLDGRTLMLPDYEIVQGVNAWPHGYADLFPDRHIVYAVPMPEGMDIPPEAVPMRNASGRSYAVFPSQDSIPESLREQAIFVMRHGDEIRAGAGFGELVSATTRRVGATNVFDFLAGQGGNGLIDAMESVRQVLRNAERSRVFEARADPSARARYLQERYPGTMGPDQIPPLSSEAGTPRVIEAPPAEAEAHAPVQVEASLAQDFERALAQPIIGANADAVRQIARELFGYLQQDLAEVPEELRPAVEHVMRMEGGQRIDALIYDATRIAWDREVAQATDALNTYFETGTIPTESLSLFGYDCALAHARRAGREHPSAEDISYGAGQMHSLQNMESDSTYVITELSSVRHVEAPEGEQPFVEMEALAQDGNIHVLRVYGDRIRVVGSSANPGEEAPFLLHARRMMDAQLADLSERLAPVRDLLRAGDISGAMEEAEGFIGEPTGREVPEPGRMGIIPESPRPEEPALRTPEAIQAELDGIGGSLDQLVREGRQREPQYRELLANAEDLETLLELNLHRGDEEYMDRVRSDPDLEGEIEHAAAMLSDARLQPDREGHADNMDIVRQRARLRAQLQIMREEGGGRGPGGAGGAERPSAPGEEVSAPTAPTPIRQGAAEAGEARVIRTEEMLSERTEALVERLASESDRGQARDGIVLVGNARVEGLLANLGTISDAAERDAALTNLTGLLVRVGWEAGSAERERSAESFIASASDRELLLLVMDRRIDTETLPYQIYDLLNLPVPVDDPEEFRLFIDGTREIGDENLRNLATGIVALRTFERLREITGPLQGDERARSIDQMGYPPELRPAAEFIRRFGLDPRVHEGFRLNSRDLMSRAELFHQVEAMEAEFTSELNTAFPGNERLVADIMGRISESITVQDVSDTNLPYTPHGWAHSLEVVRIGRQVFDASPRLRESLIRQFGSRERALAALDLANLLHDIGYGELPPGAKKTAHPQVGADLFESRFSADVARLFGIDPQGMSGRELIDAEPRMGDIYRAILLHGADNPGRADYTPASDTVNPLLFITRLADNLDMSVGRMRAIQTDPVMLRALQELYEASPRIHQENPRLMNESSDAYEARLRPLFEPIRSRYRVTPEMESSFRSGPQGPEGSALPLFAQGRTFEDALLMSELLDTLNDMTWPHFIGCERVMGFDIREMPGADGHARLDIQIQLSGTGEAGPVGPGVDGAHFQVWRTHAARRSLFYDREIPADHADNQVDLGTRYETGIDLSTIPVAESGGEEGERREATRFTLLIRP